MLFSERTVQGPCFNLIFVDTRRSPMLPAHTHDFPEIFWITRGRARHWINGREEWLEPGDLVLLRAEDRHRLTPADDAGFDFLNLAMNPGLLEAWRRIFPAPLKLLYDPSSSAPAWRRMSPRERDEIAARARDLAAGPHTPFALARFCLEVWSWFARDWSATNAVGAPDWLSEACLKIQEPEYFEGGVAAFVRLCGRAHAHVARECRRRLGRTPTEIVADARLSRAASDLRTTSRSVTEIALATGFADPACFYRRFKARYGVTPRRYRQSEVAPSSSTRLTRR